MKNNAFMPYILIMVLGLTLVFFLSLKGLSDADKMAKEGMMTKGGELKEEYKQKMEMLFKNINTYFC